MRYTGADILIRSLIDHGVDTVFGYPGGQVLDIYDELYKKSNRIRHIMTASEAGATHAADGYARATGKIGVVIATSGPGATNLVTGIATAYLDSVPLLAITGNVDTYMMGKDSFQEVDITGITMPITKYNYIVKDIRELERVIDEAIVIATSGRPGPVLIDIPRDVQRAKCEYIGAISDYTLSIPYDENDMDAIVDIVNRAHRPCIYIGGGVVASNSGETISELADRIDAPIISSLMGLGAIKSDNPRFLGMAGMHGRYAANMTLRRADVLIAVGTRFSDRATGDRQDYIYGKKVVHIDIDPAEIDKNIDTDYYLIGDTHAVTKKLLERTSTLEHPTWSKEVSKYKFSPLNANNMRGDFTPDKILNAIHERVDEDTIVATDVGQHQMWTAEYYPFSHPRTFLTSGGLGTMGFGMGASIGASVATSKRTVLITSDGSVHMNMNEMATIVSENLPVLIVVMDNKSLGMVRQFQHLFYNDRLSSSTIVRSTDYVALAEAMGMRGYHSSDMDSLIKALDEVLATNAPALICCDIDERELALPMIPPGGNVEKIILRDKHIS